jgi:hypothetical protein
MISGALSYENLFLVNGVVVNENLRAQPRNVYIEDGVQEHKISTGSTPRSTGASRAASSTRSPSRAATTSAGRCA